MMTLWVAANAVGKKNPWPLLFPPSVLSWAGDSPGLGQPLGRGGTKLTSGRILPAAGHGQPSCCVGRGWS